MADTKISGLTALTGANTASGDLIPIADVSVTTTKSITRDELALALGITIASSSGPGSIVLKEDADNGSNKITITAPSSLSSDFTHTLPAVTTTLLGQDANGASIENLGAVESQVNTVASTGSTETLDTSLYAFHDCTMDQACTFTFSNPAPSGDNTTFVLILRGAFTPTFPTLKWSGGAAATYTTPSIYTFTTVDAGTTWYAAQVGRAFA